MGAAKRTMFIKHLAMERKIIHYLDPKHETEVLAALEKWNTNA
jgi:hypothetical protein